MVVNPDGEGRRLGNDSWGDPGQISDLAAMPRIVAHTLRWLRIDERRVYAIGGSMGGQESLLLAARYPRPLAGVVAFDSVTNLALQYRDFLRLRCDKHCRRQWKGPIGVGLRQLAQLEVGGSPSAEPSAYVIRSPVNYASKLAFAHIPIELWWSTSDLIVTDQAQQSGALYWTIRQLNPAAPIEAFVGRWIHTAEMRARSRLPLALADLGLLPRRFDHRPRSLRLICSGFWPSRTSVDVDLVVRRAACSGGRRLGVSMKHRLVRRQGFHLAVRGATSTGNDKVARASRRVPSSPDSFSGQP